MSILKQTLLFIVSLSISVYSMACPFDGNETNAGSLTPTPAYQTVASVASGNYFSIAVTCGTAYNFNFCNNGGTAAWDTQITILQTDGTTQLAYNDDNCGLQSNVSWTANFNGTIYVLVSQFSCDNTGGSTGATLAYNSSPGSNSAAFTISADNCNSASSTITGNTGGTFSFNPAPGDGAVINAVTGTITNGVSGTTYTVQYDVNCGVFTTQNVTLPNLGNASFNLTVACGGANATITGDIDGTFTFNPAPGDGTQINASTGQVTNGTAGTTYFVEYTVCGTSNIESITVLTDDCFTLNGDAQYINVGGEDCIQLTAAVNGQTGCAWNGSQIDFASNFTLTLDYYFGTGGNNGADGNTFTFQPSSSTACGTAGGQLGAGGIANSLAIEFDTYDNDNPTHLYDMSCDHIAVEIDGNMQGAAPLCGPVCAKAGGGNIDDGGTYTVDIDWNAGTQQLDIYFDGNLRLSCSNDFVTNAFAGTSQVYWGATSATGGLNNQQYFCPSTIVLLPVELVSFESVCQGKEEQFKWTTATESRVDYFTIEYTYNGLVYFPVETIKAAGTSQSELDYSVNVSTEDVKQRYYRLKMVDTDGMYDYTDIISSKRCAYSENLINEIIQKNGQLSISSHKDVSVTLTNQIGQIVKKGNSNNGLTIFDSSTIKAGIYFILVEDENGIQESEKVMITNY